MSARVWRTIGSFALALVTAGLAAIVASAHHTDLTDPNDTRGKLDIEEVHLAHDVRPPVWTVVTYARWGIHQMWDRGYVELILDTRRDERPEYYVLVRADVWTLEGTLWRIRPKGRDVDLGAVPVKRRSLDSLSVEVGMWRLEFGDRRTSYRWRVHTMFTGDVCPRSCHDFAPDVDAEAVIQWRPGMSPTPTVSPSP